MLGVGYMVGAKRAPRCRHDATEAVAKIKRRAPRIRMAGGSLQQRLNEARSLLVSTLTWPAAWADLSAADVRACNAALERA
eukprot:12284360-Alexandrium_andersonii.AAC.1